MTFVADSENDEAVMIQHLECFQARGAPREGWQHLIWIHVRGAPRESQGDPGARGRPEDQGSGGLPGRARGMQGP
jgi:hypothetical protein